MAVSQIALILFLLVYGISVFVPFKYASQIAGLAAIIAGLGMIFRF